MPMFREGNKTPKKEAGPVIFVLKPIPHKSFVRRGSDLVHKTVLPLYQALCGTAIEVPTLDNRWVWFHPLLVGTLSHSQLFSWPYPSFFL